MLGNTWINLFRRIPANLHDNLALTLTNGMEIVIQRILKLDSDFAILRGRMAGTQDQGRVVVVPYQQFLSVAFTKRMTDPEALAIFGNSTTTFAEAIVLSGANDPDAPLTDGASEPEAEDTVNDGAPEVNAPARPEMPSKSILLAKLRARLTEQGK